LRDLDLGSPVNWGSCYLPHDGFAKRHQTGKMDAEVLQGLGWTVAKVPEIGVEAGIKRARELFPRVYFNRDATGRLVECLKRYRRDVSQRTGEPGNPIHDEFSHGADAFRYVAVCVDDMTNESWGGALKYPKMNYA
jgi:phage terminase large subunit